MVWSAPVERNVTGSIPVREIKIMSEEQNLCYNCSKEFKSLSKHWSMSTNCSYPNFSSEQIEILTGVVMGDGCVDRHSSKNWNIICSNIKREYLEYLCDKLENFSRQVRVGKTAKQSAQSSRFVDEPEQDNYNTIYRWQTISHPEINDKFDWAVNGNKTFPKNINLSSTVLTNWYCCDGHFENPPERIRISMSNESENKDKIESYFADSGLPKPSGYNEINRDDGSSRCGAYWTKADTNELFSYMNEPIPGFEYKWPERFK